MTNLRVWWIPNVPMKAFTVEVKTVLEAAKILEVLAAYDMFQFENNIKPDYCNVGCLSILEDREWVDWCDEYTGISDPVEYLAAIKQPSYDRQTTTR